MTFAFSFGLSELFDPNVEYDNNELEALFAVRDREVEDYLSQVGSSSSSSSLDIQGALVSTSQTTTSISFTDLATVGPAVTLTVNTKALVTVGAYMEGNAGGWTHAGYGMTGANALTASNATSAQANIGFAGDSERLSFQTYLDGLTPGATTFTMKYKVNLGGGTGTFADRNISVVLLD